MSHAKSETSALRKHLYKFHGFNTSSYTGLQHEQLLQVHSAFHEDEWITRPHSHPQGPDEFDAVDATNCEEYFSEVVKMVTEDSE